jgi:hypothetical protein
MLHNFEHTRIIVCKHVALFGSFESLYDDGHEWWWMSIASKLNVGPYVLLNTNLLFFALEYLYKINV